MIKRILSLTSGVLLLAVFLAPAASAGPTPLAVSVSIDRVGTVDRAGNAVITATVTCNRRASQVSLAEWFLQLDQKVHGSTFVADNDGDVPRCGFTPETFQMLIAGNGAPFVIKPGPARVDLFVVACTDLTCSQVEATGTVRLHRTRG